MSADFKYFPDLLGESVTATRLLYDTNNILPCYEFGTYLELMQQCQIKDNNQSLKYPLVWLVWDGEENQAKWFDPCGYTIAPRIFIASLTSQDYTTDQRYTYTLKPILYAIFILLLDEMENQSHVEMGQSTYTVKDHPFWLNNADGSFDILSAIEVKFENILISD